MSVLAREKDIYDRIKYIIPGFCGMKKYELVRLFFPLDLEREKGRGDGSLCGKRIVIKGDAGTGKTTLLKRLYIYFLSLRENAALDDEIKEKYNLPAGCRPILVRLKELKTAVSSLYQAAAIQGAIDNNTILLLDGIDEIPAAQRKVFLSDLEKILTDFPDMRVIMTGRYSGFESPEDEKQLSAAGFENICIRTLTDAQIPEYAGRLIFADGESNEARANAQKLSDIYTKLNVNVPSEIMRRPLELEMVLGRMVNGEEFTFTDRADIFFELLTGLLGRRKAPEIRESVCSDLLNLLGTLAFYSMKEDSLYAEADVLQKVYEESTRLPFAAERLKPGCVEELKAVFDKISAKTGLIEKSGRGFTFTIRAYQEYLCAYACANLALEKNKQPEPFHYVKERVNDDFWQGAISFMLSLMEKGRSRDFPATLKFVFENMESEAGLKTIIDAGAAIDKESAFVLSGRFFERCHPWDSGLLLSCLTSSCAGVWKCVIKDQYNEKIGGYTPKGDCSDVMKPFLLAYVFSLIITEPEAADPDRLLKINTEGAQISGAQLISLMVSIYLDEMMPEYKKEAQRVLESVTDAVDILMQKAETTGDFVYIKALSDIWVSGCAVSDTAGKACSEEMVLRIAEMIDNSELIYLDTWQLSMDTKKDMMNADATATLISTLGALPLSKRLAEKKIKNLNSYAFIRGQFMYLGDLWMIERIGSAFATIYCYRDREMFRDIWEVMVKEIIESGECGKRGRNIYRLQSNS